MFPHSQVQEINNINKINNIKYLNCKINCDKVKSNEKSQQKIEQCWLDAVCKKQQRLRK